MIIYRMKYDVTASASYPNGESDKYDLACKVIYVRRNSIKSKVFSFRRQTPILSGLRYQEKKFTFLSIEVAYFFIKMCLLMHFLH